MKLIERKRIYLIALGSNVIASQTDTLNVSIINGEKIEKFDGSQLVGKTISDYKTMTTSSTINGVTSVTKMSSLWN